MGEKMTFQFEQNVMSLVSFRKDEILKLGIQFPIF